MPSPRRLLLWSHLALALAGGLLLAVVTLSGAAVAFRDQLDRQHAAPASAAPRAADPDRVATALRARWPDARIVRLTLADAGDTWELRGPADGWKAFTDPGDGTLLGHTRDRALPAALAWLAGFHHDLHLGRGGRRLVGVAGLVLLGLLATGLPLWWPGWRRLADGLRLRLARGSFLRCFDLHTWAGLLGLPLLLVTGLTGAMFAFPWLRTAVHLSLGGTASELPSRPVTAERQPETAELGFARAIAAAEAAAPGRALGVLPPRPERGDGIWTVLLDHPGNLSSRSGVLVRLAPDATPSLVLDPRSMSTGGWVHAQLWGLHTGTWGGGWSQALYLGAGLLPSLLLGTGLGIWWYRHRQRSGAVARRMETTSA